MGPDENLEPKNEQEQDQSFALVFLSHENRITNHGATIIAKAHGSINCLLAADAGLDTGPIRKTAFWPKTERRRTRVTGILFRNVI
jgi:hypothetical protein